MSTEADDIPTERFERIEQRLEEMVERKWTPLREKNDSEPMEVWSNERGVHVGEVNAFWSPILLADVIRTFNRGHYEFVGGHSIRVCPTNAREFYAVPEGMDVKRAAVIKALDETGIHVPNVRTSMNSARLEHFETRETAERAAAALEEPINSHYEEMWGESIDKVEIREFGEPRDWLAPDPVYTVFVNYG